MCDEVFKYMDIHPSFGIISATLPTLPVALMGSSGKVYFVACCYESKLMADKSPLGCSLLKAEP